MSESHLDRLTEQRTESIETSQLHLDLLRDLKRINAHFASIGRQMLERTGEMAATRLSPQKGHGGSREQTLGDQTESAATEDPGDNPRTPVSKNGTQH